MAGFKFKKMCRCCLRSNNDINFFRIENGKVNNNNDISAMFSCFQGIKFSDSENLPKWICEKCLLTLQATNEFCTKYLQSQIILENYSKQFEMNSPKLPILLPKSNDLIYNCLKCNENFQRKVDFDNHFKNHKIKRKYKCFDCKKVFLSTRSLSKHRQQHFNETENICKFCNYFFINKTILNQHILENHKNSYYICKLCKQNDFSSKWFLIRHLKSSHNIFEQLFHCNECETTIDDNNFIGIESILNHINTIHVDFKENNVHKQNLSIQQQNPEDLDNMNEEFLDEIFLNQNENFEFYDSWDNFSLTFDDELKSMDLQDLNTIDMLSNNRYKCPKCDMKFSQQFLMLKHLAHEHNDNVLVCNECGLTFNRYKKLEDHRLEHLNDNLIIQNNNNNNNSEIDNKYECKKCNKKYLKKINFLKHICSKDENSRKSIQCNICSEMFKTNIQMYQHQKNSHDDDKQLLQCSLCDKTFKTIAGMKYHLKTHTGFKSFTCPYCMKTFLANINLNSHIRTIHAEIKTNICNLCDRKFATLDHLKKHVMSFHQKERNHLCSVCGKSFSQVSHLTQHTFIHTGERNYHCDFCQSGFIKKSDFKKHLEKMHSNMI